MIYMDRAEFMGKTLGPDAGRQALVDGAVHYARAMANSVAPIPSPDIPLVIAAALTTVHALSKMAPSAMELAERVAEDLKQVSGTAIIPDPESIQKWREQQPPPK